jgi:hypothetical protein
MSTLDYLVPCLECYSTHVPGWATLQCVVTHQEEHHTLSPWSHTSPCLPYYNTATQSTMIHLYHTSLYNKSMILLLCHPFTPFHHTITLSWRRSVGPQRSWVAGHDTQWLTHMVRCISCVACVWPHPSVPSLIIELRGKYIHIYYLSSTSLTHCT